jgi:hypothetical protein
MTPHQLYRSYSIEGMVVVVKNVKPVFVATSNVLSQYLPVGTEGNHKRSENNWCLGQNLKFGPLQ